MEYLVGASRIPYQYGAMYGGVQYYVGGVVVAGDAHYWFD
jgi:hypothetical protein